MKILVTGGAGFIGSNFIRLLINNSDYEVVNIDRLTYAGNLNNLRDIENNKRYKFIKGDICNPEDVKEAVKDCSIIVNFAAESHVDRSINDPSSFIKTDIFGAFTLLEEARKNNLTFCQVSTDEVYGQILEGSFTETSPLMPRNPYSASKTGADRLAYSYFSTYGLNVIITRSSNNFGPFQYPEKVIPLFVTNLLTGKKVPVYGTGKQIRDWLYVEDNCEGIKTCMEKGRSGEVYNIGG
ncbi:MAG: dTDP-glucose 4,6-dehydratase, partial [Nanoarchaeota archaeon]